MTNREVLESIFGCEAERVLKIMQKNHICPLRVYPCEKYAYGNNNNVDCDRCNREFLESEFEPEEQHEEPDYLEYEEDYFVFD